MAILFICKPYRFAKEKKMKIQRLINSIQSNNVKRKILQNEERINRYVKIHDVTTPVDSFNQMYTARSVIANYAEKKGVSINIYNAGKCPPPDNTTADNKLNVIVTDLLTGNAKAKLVDADTDRLYPKVSENPIIIPILSDCTDIVRQSIKNTEDTFLRNLYRNIEELTKEVTSKNTK